MKHTPHDDSVIEVLLGVFTEEQLSAVIAEVPEYLSAPLDDAEHLEWLNLAADLHDLFPNVHALAEVAAIYAQTVGGFTIAGIEYMPTNVINIVKSITAGECSAKRCGSESVENVAIDGRKVPLCQRHIDAMVLSGQIDAGPQSAEARTLVLPFGAAVDEPRDRDGVLSAPTDAYSAELATETEAAKTDLAAIEDFEIATQDDMDLAAAVISEAKERSGKLEARMQEITKPMRAAEKSVRDLFRPALTALGDIERIVKGKVGAYKLEQDARNAAALKAAAEAVAKGEDATKALAGVVHTENTPGLGTRDVVKWEVLDEDAVPRELCSPDDRKIRVAIKDEHTVIPGLRIYKDVSVISRKT